MMSARKQLLALACLASLTACTGVPSSGEVVKVSPANRARVERGVQVHPVAPQAGASPDTVLAGFLDAMASLEPGFGVARQYLTPDAAASWDPHAGVTVFDGDTRSSLPGSTTAGLQARVVGRLDRQGHYSADTGRMLRQSFTMQQVDGQWRISNPPPGLLVSHYTLQHRFSPTTLWFYARGSQSLVPERIWLASNPASPVEAVQALLQGPSGWLAPAVSSAIPVGTRLAVAAVGITDGVAEVPLDATVARLPEAERSRAIAQIGWALQPFAEIRRLRVTVDGQPWGSELSMDALPGGAGLPAASDEQPLAVLKDEVGRLDDQGAFAPLPGALGNKGWKDRPGRLAASATSGLLAVVNRDGTRLVTTTPGQDQPQTRLQGKGMGRPVVTTDGQIWVQVAGDAAAALRRGTAKGPMVPVNVPALTGTSLVNFAISPDQTRMAVVLQRKGRSELGLLRLHGDRVDGYRRMPLQVSQLELDQVVDVGWTGQEELMVLAAQHPGARATGYLVSADAAQVEPVGPAGDTELVEVVSRPQAGAPVVLLRASTGEILRYDSPWRWRSLPRRVEAVGVPS